MKNYGTQNEKVLEVTDLMRDNIAQAMERGVKIGEAEDTAKNLCE